MASEPTPANNQPAPIDLANMVSGIDKNHLLQLLQTVPGMFPRVVSGEGGKEDIAQVLSSLAANPALYNAVAAAGHLPPDGYPVGEPGPSSHPRGPPPNLAQLGAAVAMQPPEPAPDHDDEDGEDTDNPAPASAPTSGGRRSRSGAAMGSEEWQRQRKDNHKEVERRRRNNINEGINELGRIVPNGSGEKAKGAILSRAVQYIHHLKENEARNIEKWTLEKLLMDQAMGDLQNQLEEVRRMWDEERSARQRAEAELEVLRGGDGVAKTNGVKRSNDEPETGDDDAKRKRTD